MLTAVILGALMLQGPAQATTGAPPKTQDAKPTAAEIQHQKDIDSDIEMGKKFSAEVEKSSQLSDNKQFQDRVNRIGQEIAKIAQTTPVDVIWGDKRLNKFNYTFKVLKGEDVNAFSLPGGFIYVYEGLVKYVQSDDELAAVLAHEISHSEERHIATLAKEQQKVTTPGLIAVLVSLISKNPAAIETTIMASQLTAASFTSQWSVDAEKAADHGGFQYLLHSKYNPTAMLTLMERLALDEHSTGANLFDWGIYRTHPPSKERAESVLRDMHTYGIPVQRSLVTTRFRAEVKPGKDGGVDIWFNDRRIYTFYGSDALQRADDAASRLNPFFDQVPNLFEVSFEGTEVLGRRHQLFNILPEDAQGANSTVADLGQQAVTSIRGALYNYAFNIWVQ